MTIFQIPASNAMAWLLAFAFAGAGLFNGIGGASVQSKFLRWGYPAWWNFVTAAVEILCAALIVFVETRYWGLALGALVMIAAIATLIWRRDYKELPPGVIFTALIGVDLALMVLH
jgi:drug/metabolite transporter superfamily protein YnfA